ncbi:MAG: amidohydrolase family protein, partial [Acidimicrobiia bacterium]|nr:amidohydrolase family protein [Acidimicrobiia bacterium]
LTAMAEFASGRNELITLHLNETPVCERVVRGRTGLEPAAWLQRAGFLGPNVLLVHCINVSDDEIALIRASGASVSYNPVSNMYMGNGVAPIPKLIEAGVPVGLATDGAASNNRQDMVEVIKAAVLLQRAAHRTGKVMSGRQSVDLATRGSAASLSRSDSLGTLEIGKRADIVLFDFLSVASSVPSHDPVSTLAFSARPSSTRWVIVGGDVVLDDGELPNLDEGAALAAAQGSARRILTSVGAI